MNAGRLLSLKPDKPGIKEFRRIRRAGKFVLADQSSDGTFVVIAGAREIRLKREEMILYGSGRFAFGHSTADSGAEVVEFDCNVK